MLSFESIDIMAAIQNVMSKRFERLVDGGMTKKDAYFRVYEEFERSLTDIMRQQARLIYLERGVKNGNSKSD